MEFGVSGILHNSDLVLFDRSSKTLWQQITGKAFAGPLRGQELVSIPLRMTDWQSWKKEHPASQVLSLDTGFDEEYDTDHYVEYRSSERLFAGGTLDPRLHAKRVVYGFETDWGDIAFDAELFAKNNELVEKLNSRDVAVTKSADGEVILTDNESGASWSAKRMFWFAWYSFHTRTALIDGN